MGEKFEYWISFNIFSYFQPFLAIFRENGWFFKTLKNRDTGIVRTYPRKFWVRNSKIRSVLTYSQNFGHFWRFWRPADFLRTSKEWRELFWGEFLKYLLITGGRIFVFKNQRVSKNRQKWPRFWEYVKTDLIFDFLTQNFLE